LQSTFIEYDIRKPIENLPFTPTEDDVIFNFAAEELKNCGYQFKWSFEEALADWFEDKDKKGLK
jgi:hypothetical protein